MSLFRPLAFLIIGVACLCVRGEEPLAVLMPARTNAVDFRREVLPLLQANCLPCHSKTTAKGDLLLETPEDMLKGGETGPALVPGEPGASLLLRLSSHAEKPRMPPRENKVNAVELTSAQLGLIALWIQQGAKEGERSAEVIPWLGAPPELRAIYAVALTPEAEYVACGRGNRLFIYHRPTAQPVAELTDPATGSSDRAATAQRDLVGSLAFRPDGRQLASGGFREVKLWGRVDTAFQRANESSLRLGATNVVRSVGGLRTLGVGTNGVPELRDAEGGLVAELRQDARSQEALKAATRNLTSIRSATESVKRRVETTEKEQQLQTERLGRAREAQSKAAEIPGERERARDKAATELREAEAALAGVKSDATTEERKSLTNRIEAAQKPVDETRRAFEEATRKLSVADDELRLAEAGLQQSRGEFQRWKDMRQDLTNRLSLAEQRLNETETAAQADPGELELAALSPEAHWAATVVGGPRIALWSGLTGEPIETWDAPGRVEAMDFGTNQTLRIRCADGEYVRGLLPHWELRRVLGGEAGASPMVDRVGALAYSADGLWLASGSGEPSRSGDVQWWDPVSGTLGGAITNLHSDSILCLAFSPDGALLASGGADRFARLVDVARCRPWRALEGHTGHVLAVAWKDDNATLATGGADLMAKFWDGVTGGKRKQAAGFEREVTGLGFLGGDLWVAAGSPKELRVINENGERVRGLSGLTDPAYSLAVSADGKWIVAGGEAGALRVWERETEAPKLVFEVKVPAFSATAR